MNNYKTSVAAYSKLLQTLENANDIKNKYLQQFCSFLEGTQDLSSTEFSTDKKHVFLYEVSQYIKSELECAPQFIHDNFEKLNNIINTATDLKAVVTDENFQHAVWNIFNAEAQDINLSACIRTQKSEGQEESSQIQKSIEKIRNRRTITIETQNPNPIKNPSKEIIFTSNILLCPPKKNVVDSLDLSEESKQKLHTIIDSEEQLYWYDHPMALGIEKEANELIYGLQGLADALAFEKKNDTLAPDSTFTVLLSVSVTHPSLATIAHEYLQKDLENIKFDGLQVYVFTEDDTKKIADILGADNKVEVDTIKTVFGVDGRYGRHYSFLKAIAAVWSDCVDDEVKATFKIDLDQVFPQEKLLQETNKTMVEHFCTPLWGAIGRDSEGNEVELGMIAGALVNEADIQKGLFTPDVNFPSFRKELDTQDILFPRTYFMALSTRAELMTRYSKHLSSGEALQRVHVTGGTNGILIDSLKKHRPFTPTFIARAEDQAYILSVFFAKDNNQRYLRYVHADGLFMRHDKAAFASEAIKEGKYGSYAGDLLRTIVFSKYADSLPGGQDAFVKYFSPFTSCFASKIPISFSIARLLLNISVLSQTSEANAITQLEVAINVLENELKSLTNNPDKITQLYNVEKEAWNIFYDSLLDIDEQQKEKIKNYIMTCKI